MARVESPQSRYLFERVMFWAMLPGLLVPVAAAVTLVIIRSAQDDGHNYGIYALPVYAAIPFLWILLGSELLRAWKWLRHPSTLTAPLLPRRSAVTRCVIYALTLIFPLTFLRDWPLGIAVVLGLVIAGLAIHDHSLILSRDVVVFEPFAGTRPRLAAKAPVALGTLVAITMAVGIIATIAESRPFVLVATLILVTISLPWSYGGIIVALFGSGLVDSPFTFLVMMSMVATINIVIVWRISRDDASYQRAVTRFFRLTPVDAIVSAS